MLAWLDHICEFIPSCAQVRPLLASRQEYEAFQRLLVWIRPGEIGLVSVVTDSMSPSAGWMCGIGAGALRTKYLWDCSISSRDYLEEVLGREALYCEGIPSYSPVAPLLPRSKTTEHFGCGLLVLLDQINRDLDEGDLMSSLIWRRFSKGSVVAVRACPILPGCRPSCLSARLRSLPGPVCWQCSIGAIAARMRARSVSSPMSSDCWDTAGSG